MVQVAIQDEVVQALLKTGHPVTQESYLSLAHPEDEPTMPEVVAGLQISFTISQKQRRPRRPAGQALGEILGPDRQYAPNTLISASRPAIKDIEQQLNDVERLISEGNPIEIGKESGRSRTASVRLRH